MRKNPPQIGFRIYTAEAQHWLAWIGAEHDNLRAALGWSLGPGNDPQLAVPIVALAFWFWYRRGHLREGREWCQRVLEKFDHKNPSPQNVYILGFAGMLATWQGDLESGLEMIQEGTVASQMIEDDQSMGLALMGNGIVLLNRGDAAGAFPLLETGLKIFRELKLNFFVANSLIHMANSSLALGNISGARGYLEQSLPIAKQVGDDWLIASILNNMGEVARVEGNYPQAQQYYEESEGLFRKGGDIEDQNRLVHSLGYIALYRGDMEQAEQLFHKSMTIFRELGVQRGIAECLAGFARLASVRGQPETAVKLLAAATTTMHAHRGDWWPADQVEVRASLKGMHAVLGDVEFEAAWQVGKRMDLEQALELEASGR